MADISKIKVGATTYNIKDSTVRSDYLKSTADTGSGHHTLLSGGGWRSYGGADVSSTGISCVASSTPRAGLYVYNSTKNGTGWMINEESNGSLQVGPYLDTTAALNIRTGSNQGPVYLNGNGISTDRTASDYGVIWGLKQGDTGFPRMIYDYVLFPGVATSKTTSTSLAASKTVNICTLTLPKKGIYIATGTLNVSSPSGCGASISGTSATVNYAASQSISGARCNLAWLTDAHDKNDKIYLIAYTNSSGSVTVTSAYFRAVWVGAAYS